MMPTPTKPLTILISSYACGPNWGSEIGMGWNWIISLSNHCRLTVITESDFRKDIEKKIPDLNLKYVPDFHYIDVRERGRELFWKQGSSEFYTHYKIWQKKVLILAKELISVQDFDIVHQLNMIGYREPGYLWKIKELPFVFGPVGGYNQFPGSFFSILSFKDKFFYLVRNILNLFQMYLLNRPKKAYRKAEYVVLATQSGMNIVSKYTSRTPIIIAETGVHENLSKIIKNKPFNDKFVLTWVGIVTGRKALPIAIKSIAKSKYRAKLILNVVGDGPNIKRCKKLAKQLKLDNIIWHGKISNIESKKIITESSMLFFTSVLDATSTVIFEALEVNTPVLCHDISGFGTVINDSCGIKIPLLSPRKSIIKFSEKIDFLIENPEEFKNRLRGCEEVIKKYYWDEKAQKMHKIYKQCLQSLKD